MPRKKPATKEIKIPEESILIIDQISSKFDELEMQMKNYAMGLRHGLKIPNGWVLDIKKKAFVPPPSK